MSASMYNSPYTYKEPPPRIDYPPLLNSLHKITFGHFFDSKFLALGALIQGVALLVTLITVILPFWFQLIFSPREGTFGSEPLKRELTIDCGLFYLHESELDNTAFLNKYSNREVLPNYLVLAQVFSVTGTCLLVASFTATLILGLRRFASVTGTIILAFFSSLAALFLVLVIVFVAVLLLISNCDYYDDSDCKYEDNMVWRMVPIYSQFYRVEPHVTPYVKANWAFFIAIIGALVAIGGAVMVWIEAMMAYRSQSQIRYHQLRQKRDPYEHDVDPSDGKKYLYAPPVRAGPLTYGMQPVVQSTGVYGYVPQSTGYYPPAQVGFATPGPKVGFGPPQPGYGGGPPSTLSSASAPTREIDL